MEINHLGSSFTRNLSSKKMVLLSTRLQLTSLNNPRIFYYFIIFISSVSSFFRKERRRISTPRRTWEDRRLVRVHRGTCATDDASLSRLECVSSVTKRFPYSYGKRRASWFFEPLTLSLRFASLARLQWLKVIHAHVSGLLLIPGFREIVLRNRCRSSRRWRVFNLTRKYGSRITKSKYTLTEEQESFAFTRQIFI